MRTLSPVVYRGEYDGRLRPQSRSPYFFAESRQQAKLYARNGSDPIECVITGRSVLDLTNPNPANPDHRRLVEAVSSIFDDWTCRYSGEERDLWSYLEAGDLYDYEGTGSGERWKALFDTALHDMGFDAVRILDCTDGTDRQASPVWVTHRRENIRLATLGETVAAKLERGDEKSFEELGDWIERHHPDLASRIKRLNIVEDDYRLDQVHKVIPKDNFAKMGRSHNKAQTIWRSLPTNKDIRPGDWVALSRQYAEFHLRDVRDDQEGFEVKSLAIVDHEDIFWARTDEREFFYLPAAWRKGIADPVEYLRSLTSEQIRILCDGEQSRISLHMESIRAIERKIIGKFDPETRGSHHGPEHWGRVEAHGHAVARHLGIDPLVPHLFALIHDSHREDDDFDPGHGARAAEFVRSQRSELLAFLEDEEIEMLASACELHSEGHIHAPAHVQACWDADRLDLWRVGIEPSPRLLCTEYARKESVIEHAAILADVIAETSDTPRIRLAS